AAVLPTTLEFCFTGSARVPSVAAGKVKSSKAVKNWSTLREKLRDLIIQAQPEKIVDHFKSLDDVLGDGEETPEDIIKRLAQEHAGDIQEWLKLNSLEKLARHHKAFRRFTHGVTNAVEEHVEAHGKGTSLLKDVIMPILTEALPVKHERSLLCSLCVSIKDPDDETKPILAASRAMKSIFGGESASAAAGHFSCLRSRYIVRGLAGVLAGLPDLDAAEHDVAKLLRDVAKGDANVALTNQFFAQWDIALMLDQNIRGAWSDSWADLLQELAAQYAGNSRSPAEALNDVAENLVMRAAVLTQKMKQQQEEASHQ
ncbi:unnamed protein product, partial [Prorocentrum cordatum]